MKTSRQSSRLPMFPLGSPLLPGQLLPLRIFEPRYVALLRACLAQDWPEFGVVLIERGFEVGGGDQRAAVGTVAGIIEAHARPMGDFAVVAYGRRRIRVVEWQSDDPHPWALVEDWPDPDDTAIDTSIIDSVYRRTATLVIDRLREVLTLAGAGIRHEEQLLGLVDALANAAPSQVSYSLAALARFGAADQHRLLRCEGALARLSLILELLDDLEAVIRFQTLD